eukprot:TRINITY_DN18410_c0_g1_i4.p1 TRINITY_DN18410_c0_g1~~TRINITY_DN18410_c0_g1_i4.p1  ORF type:complete len:488 (-),score=93.20 TRINITY_DN18410_c0_g1_i4:14-1477(-)
MQPSVQQSSLPCVDDLPALPDSAAASEGSASRESPFPCAPELNLKATLWLGELWRLNTDAVFSVVNEDFGCRSGTAADALWRRAGHGLRQAVQDHGRLDAGEAILTEAFGLESKAVIHTVSPCFDVKFKTASECALASSYWRGLSLVKEHSLRSVGLDMVHDSNKKYPADAGAHIACRVARRFLEKYGAEVDRVVFACPNQEMWDTYAGILPFYFPRTPEEQQIAAQLLPEDVGDETGQPRIEARAMYDSILHVPVAERVESSPLDQSFREDIDSWLSEGGFGEFKTQGESAQQHQAAVGRADNVDHERALEVAYGAQLRKAQAMDLDDIAKTGWIYKCGVARDRSTVIAVNPAALLELRPAHHRVLAHFLCTLDQVAHKPYLIVYIHTDVPNEYQPARGWISEVHQRLVYRYRKNVRNIFVFNTSLWLRTVFAFVVPPTKKLWRNKLYFMSDFSELHQFIDDSQLAIDPSLVKPASGPVSFLKSFF